MADENLSSWAYRMEEHLRDRATRLGQVAFRSKKQREEDAQDILKSNAYAYANDKKRRLIRAIINSKKLTDF